VDDAGKEDPILDTEVFTGKNEGRQLSAQKKQKSESSSWYKMCNNKLWVTNKVFLVSHSAFSLF